jgi:hypothetical protein
MPFRLKPYTERNQTYISEITKPRQKTYFHEPIKGNFKDRR